MTQPTSPPRLIKWPTYLSITTDAVLTMCGSEGFVHTMDSTLFDAEDRTVATKLSLWSRIPPADGTALLTGVALATKPLRIAVPDAANLRAVPEEFDGTDPAKPSLPTAAPFMTGIGVVKSVGPTRKTGVVAGYVFLGKATGWVLWEIEVAFEDSPQWAAWLVSAPRSLVTFDAVLARVDEDGTVHGNLRRMSYICDAHRLLLQSLGIGAAASPSDRVAKMAEIRMNASKTKRARDENANVAAENGNSTSTSVASTSARPGVADHPSSPTPTPTPSGSKRNRTVQT
ncbi:hypothetical protein CF319_g6172 [Tilletia indica]|uniref:Uncharacterized protein n=1 Tax=Tilletia indica TaxID=43049 RepID=A0A177TFV9_9BASI|nr:hypothetical protein CF326_g9387 [Tilletia indica]KAE8220271.1 hypothetical protein CF319_g6172 [Tilletia indica]KAE8249629.1 hypothetical protein A4X13_0g5131 [Tilletia indica]